MSVALWPTVSRLIFLALVLVCPMIAFADPAYDLVDPQIEAALQPLYMVVFHRFVAVLLFVIVAPICWGLIVVWSPGDVLQRLNLRGDALNRESRFFQAIGAKQAANEVDQAIWANLLKSLVVIALFCGLLVAPFAIYGSYVDWYVYGGASAKQSGLISQTRLAGDAPGLHTSLARIDRASVETVNSELVTPEDDPASEDTPIPVNEVSSVVASLRVVHDDARPMLYAEAACRVRFRQQGVVQASLMSVFFDEVPNVRQAAREITIPVVESSVSFDNMPDAHDASVECELIRRYHQDYPLLEQDDDFAVSFLDKEVHFSNEGSSAVKSVTLLCLFDRLGSEEVTLTFDKEFPADSAATFGSLREVNAKVSGGTYPIDTARDCAAIKVEEVD